MIDREKALQQLAGIKISGDPNGNLEAFDEPVTFLPTQFWNSYSGKILKRVKEDPSLRAEVEAGLEAAAAEYGYHTGHALIGSTNFRKIIDPMVENESEDLLYGLYTLFAALGWGNPVITELSQTRMVVTADSYYESEIGEFVKVEKGAAYLMKGISRACMDLIFGEPYPNGLGTFECVQARSKELGDSFAEFIVTARGG